MVEGAHIDFSELPVQEKMSNNHKFSTEQIHVIDLEVSEFLKKGVIRKAHHSNKEYISPIFVRPKKDNRWRMILNDASRLNHQLPWYISYKPDLDAEAVNAFTMSWSDVRFYAFTPFCIIPSVLHKIIKDRARGILIVPDWPSQPWYPVLARGLMQRPVLVSARENLLVLPTNPEAKHRLRKALRLIICEVSGRDSEALVFLRQLGQSYAHPGVAAPADNMPRTSQGGRGIKNKWGIHSISPSVSE